MKRNVFASGKGLYINKLGHIPMPSKNSDKKDGNCLKPRKKTQFPFVYTDSNKSFIHMFFCKTPTELLTDLT